MTKTSTENFQNALAQTLERSAKQEPPPNAPAPRGMRRSWVAAAWLLAAAAWVSVLWPAHEGESEVRAELDGLMAQGRASVESYLRNQGVMPATLPDPALVPVMRYTVLNASATPPVYQLEANIGRVAQVWRGAVGEGQ